MPGTIQISVLDIVNLPFPSTPSSMSIKVTMGKREYQIGDDGDFSIPLTTLRENLVVRLLDKDGNEVSRTAVETKLVVEKGLWDDFFPFEGGGEVHLKIWFTLSEEEQNRIRMMRLSALKKKHGELLNPNSKVAESASAVRSKVATEGNVETSGSHGHPQVGSKNVKAEMALGASVSGSFEVADIKSGIRQPPQPSQKQIIPIKDHTQYRSEDTSPSTPSQRIDSGPTTVSSKEIFKKIENQSPNNAVLAVASKAEKDSLFPYLMSTSSTVKTSLVFPGLEEGVFHNMEAQDRLESTPSNVRKMISVFESSAQDMQPRTEAPLAKTEPSMSRTEEIANHQFKKIKIEISKGAELIPGKIHSTFLKEELQQALSGSETGVGPTRPLHGIKSSHDPGHSELTTMENQRDSSHAQSSKQHDSSGNVVGQSEKVIDSVDSQKIKFRRASNDKVKSMSCCQGELNVFERSGAWIFADEHRNLCITTGGKKAMHLMGCCGIETSTWRENIRISMPKNSGEHMKGRRNGNEVKKDQKSSYRKIRPETDGSTDVDPSGGPIGQVMKVAIMVGFGALVLLTRQRKDR